MIFNAEKLDAELKAAGVPILGCSSDGRVDFADGATGEDLARAAEVLAAHDPAPSSDQKIRALGTNKLLVALALLATTNPLTKAQRAWAQDVIDTAVSEFGSVIL